MSTVPAGWHPDPSNPGALRWWDGAAWTHHTQPVPQAATPAVAAVPTNQFGTPLVAQAPAPAWYGTQAPAAPGYNAYAAVGPAQPLSFTTRNRFSLIAAGVVALYVVVAFALHVVFFGILPVGLAIRALGRKEPLAPVAIAAAVIAILVAILALA